MKRNAFLKYLKANHSMLVRDGSNHSLQAKHLKYGSS